MSCHEGEAEGAAEGALCELLSMEGDAESARILAIFDELAFVVNLLRRTQETNKALAERVKHLEKELSEKSD